MAEAYAQLAAEGWLRARRGAGTEVAAVASRLPAARVPAAPPPPPPRHDLRPGHPDVSAFPRAAWTRALRAALEEAPDAVLQGTTRAGSPSCARRSPDIWAARAVCGRSRSGCWCAAAFARA